jgi:hypothetical protein
MLAALRPGHEVGDESATQASAKSEDSGQGVMSRRQGHWECHFSELHLEIERAPVQAVASRQCAPWNRRHIVCMRVGSVKQQISIRWMQHLNPPNEEQILRRYNERLVVALQTGRLI